MAGALRPLLWTAVSLAVAPFAFYGVFIGLLATPFCQRHALYLHKINTLLWADVNRPESWGFASNQVTPFTLDTPDGESVYAWHITPLPVYLKNEAALSGQPPGLSPNFADTESFRLLKEDAEARLVLYCTWYAEGAIRADQEQSTECVSGLDIHTAGHVAQAIRPDAYHALTDTSSYHVVAIDYRGFGHSTGVPSEDGLIQDGSAVVEWALQVAGIPPSRIVLLGHSLGTAVVSGVAERYAIKGVEFAGIVLVAGLSDLASMLTQYRVGGLVPVLGPFAAWPAAVRFLDRFTLDKWRSVDRMASIVRHTKTRLRLSMVHAKNDRDVPWTEDNKLFRAAANETVGLFDDGEFAAWKEARTIHKGRDGFVATWTQSSPDIIVRQELFPYGAHDPIMGYAPVTLAIMRSFDYHGTAYT